MAAEITFVMLKPLGMKHAMLELLTHLQRLGNSEYQRLVCVTRELIEAHYAEHHATARFPALVEYYQGKTVMALILNGDDIVARVREAIGPPDPRKAASHHLRSLVLQRFPDGERGWANCEQLTRGLDNFIHASDSVAAAEREVALWLPHMRGQDYHLSSGISSTESGETNHG